MAAFASWRGSIINRNGNRICSRRNVNYSIVCISIANVARKENENQLSGREGGVGSCGCLQYEINSLVWRNACDRLAITGGPMSARKRIRKAARRSSAVEARSAGGEKWGSIERYVNNAASLSMLAYAHRRSWRRQEIKAYLSVMAWQRRAPEREIAATRRMS